MLLKNTHDASHCQTPSLTCSTQAAAECAVSTWLQVALFDRIHNIRVKHIQEEYQKYMERVRSKAQSAIDQANANYQHHRAMLTARVDTMVHYLQQQYLRVSVPSTHLQLACALMLLQLVSACPPYMPPATCFMQHATLPGRCTCITGASVQTVRRSFAVV